MEVTVTKLKKNKTAEVWVSLRDFQNKQYVDIREHFLADDLTWKPTAKGIMLLPTLLPQIINGVEILRTMTDVAVALKLKKSNREEIQVAIREFEGKKYGEIRAWYWVEGGNLQPGKGVTFKHEVSDGLLEALRSAEELLAE